MNYLVLDLETANPDSASICQVGIVLVENGEIAGTLSRLIDPQDHFDYWNIKVHGIEPAHVAGCPTFSEVLGELSPLLDKRIIVTHGSFDRLAIARACQKHDLPDVEAYWLDNQTVVRRTWPQFAKRGYSLGNLAQHFGIEFRHHDALEDAMATAHIFRRALTESGKSASDWVSSVAARSHLRTAIVHQGTGGGPFSGKTVVFTGRLKVTRQEATRLAAERGFTVGATISPETTILCVGAERTASGRSSKVREAERLISGGHPLSIVSEAEFWQLISA
ncbi:exonuclease domain-containing protein [Microvirga alba]|uniref:3'-5' exoribonuclease n=1 Tax=Microvirga alba TaxID=2791025 RepID=A0A931BQY9_9HYPH|nr:exonuclease domain-containing protein [Microvirga alba]MBF9233640.1 3'-5' exoribonuclease [Microvirga alba]